MIGNTLSNLSYSAYPPAQSGGVNRSLSAPNQLTIQSSNPSIFSSAQRLNSDKLSVVDSNLVTETASASTVTVANDNTLESVANGRDDLASRQAEAQSREEKIEQQQLNEEQKIIAELSARDREVRAHEQAHAAIGGQYAGAPTYSFQRGPDGVRYAVGGEVSIDVSKEATPEETIRKAEIVRQAALAPAEPSPQDRRVAAEASRMQAEAIQELRLQRSEQAAEEREAREAEDNEPSKDALGESASSEQPANSNISTDESNSIPQISNVIGSRTYQTIASLAINNRSVNVALDQFA